MKYNIAIIDSSIDYTLISEKNRDKIVTINMIEPEGNMSHAAYVIDTLFKYSNNINKIYLYDVFGDNPRASGKAVINALERISEQNDVRLVLVCLTLANRERFEKTKEICSLLAEQNKIIIASYANRGKDDENHYPACFDSTIGVYQGAYENEPFFGHISGKSDLPGDASPEFIKTGENQYAIFGGTSKAVPKLAAYIINMFDEEDINIDKVLECLAQKCNDENENILELLKGNGGVSVESENKELNRELFQKYRKYNNIDENCDDASIMQLGNDAGKYVSEVLTEYKKETTPDMLVCRNFFTVKSLGKFIDRG